jgi:restriction endonuclease S subunit
MYSDKDSVYYTAINPNIRDIALFRSTKTEKNYSQWLQARQHSQLGLNQSEVSALSVWILPIDTTLDFNDQVESLMQQIAQNANESRKLTVLRDTLLPYLMFGRVIR